jgi:hypothetical protein
VREQPLQLSFGLPLLRRQSMELCRRCTAIVQSPDRCWFCESPLCQACWQQYGVCGCPGSDQAQAELEAARNDHERAAILGKSAIRSAKPSRRQMH